MQDQQQVPHSSGRTTQNRFTEKQRLALQMAATRRRITGGHVIAKYLKQVAKEAVERDGLKWPEEK